VPINNLMEDAATAEISRSQVWQWIHSEKGVLEDGRTVDTELFRALLAEELEKIHEKYPENLHSYFDRAAELFDEISTSDEFVDFLTLPAYQMID
jgi:malate synthase